MIGNDRVTLLDASSNPGGLAAGWEERGREVEAGMKGFWRDYPNINRLVSELGIDPFTPWETSSFFSPDGLLVEGPVLGNQPRFPTPFGQFFATNPLFRGLPLAGASRLLVVLLFPSSLECLFFFFFLRWMMA